MPYPMEARSRNLQLMKDAGDWTLALVTDPPTITENTTAGDLTYATFSGYAPLPVTWGTPVVNGDDYGEMTTTAPSVFECSTDGAPETITAVVLLQERTGVLKLEDFVNLTPPEVIEFDGDKITVTEWKLIQGSPIPVL